MNFRIFVAKISTLRSLGSYGPEALEMLHYQGSKRVMRSLMLTCFTAHSCFMLYLPVESLERQLAKQVPAVKCWIIGLCIPEPFSTEELHKRKPLIGENLQKARSPELMDEAIRMKVWRISSLSSSRETCSM